MPARTPPMFLAFTTASWTGALWMICMTSKPFMRPRTSAVQPADRNASARTMPNLFLIARPESGPAGQFSSRPLRESKGPGTCSR